MQFETALGRLLRERIRGIRLANPQAEMRESIPSTQAWYSDWRRQRPILRAALSSEPEGRPASGFRAVYTSPSARRPKCVDRDCHVLKNQAEREPARMFRECPVAHFGRDTWSTTCGNSRVAELKPNLRAGAPWWPFQRPCGRGVQGALRQQKSPHAR